MKFISKNKTLLISSNIYTPIKTIRSLTRLFVILLLYIHITNINSKQKDKKIHTKPKDSLKYLISKNHPDELQEISKIIVDKKTKDCFSEILQIFQKDFGGSKINPYTLKNLKLTEKYFNKTNTQILKKLNKINFYENKNFTGVRWLEIKQNNRSEIKHMINNHLTFLSDYIEKTYTKCPDSKHKKNYFNNGMPNLPEIIVDNYQFFYNKITEIKKYFSKFYFFKGINKFNTCVLKKEENPNNFVNDLKSGKITVTSLLVDLNIIFEYILEIIKSNSMHSFAKVLTNMIMITKGIPGL